MGPMDILLLALLLLWAVLALRRMRRQQGQGFVDGPLLQLIHPCHGFRIGGKAAQPVKRLRWKHEHAAVTQKTRRSRKLHPGIRAGAAFRRAIRHI